MTTLQSMWGTYSETHGGVDIEGTGQSLRELGARLIDGHACTVRLDHPPPQSLPEGRQALDAIVVSQRESQSDEVLVTREGGDLILSGDSGRVASIGRALHLLAEAPYLVTPSSVPTHLHIEPADGPPYSPDSTASVVFCLAPEPAP
jgi:hypothetical protein